MLSWALLHASMCEEHYLYCSSLHAACALYTRSYAFLADVCRWALQGSQRLQGSKLMRSVEAYESACGFIDATNVDKWRLLHLNAPAVELLGGCGAEGACTHGIGTACLCCYCYVLVYPWAAVASGLQDCCIQFNGVLQTLPSAYLTLDATSDVQRRCNGAAAALPAALASALPCLMPL
jgi:hypothetical protein